MAEEQLIEGLDSNELDTNARFHEQEDMADVGRLTREETKDPYEGMTEDQIVIFETQNEHRLAQQAWNADSSVPFAKDGLIARYLKFVSYDNDCDQVYCDRVTGEQVMSYDLGDPANTNPYYGAETDGECFAKKGLDIKEMIRPDQQKVSDDEIKSRYRLDPPYDGFDDWDDGYDDRDYDDDDGDF